MWEHYSPCGRCVEGMKRERTEGSLRCQQGNIMPSLAPVCICMCVCMRFCVYVCVSVYVCVYVYVRMCVWVNIKCIHVTSSTVV